MTSTQKQFNNVAEISARRKEVENAKINREFSKLEQQRKIDEQLELLTLDSIEQSQDGRRLIGILERNAKLIKVSVPFISDALGRLAPQVPGQVTMLGAISGTGKSTSTAAIAHRNYRLGKRTLIISNEESAQNVMARIACVETQVVFNDYIQDLVPMNERKAVAHAIMDITPFVTVVDHPLASTTAERVVAMLKAADDKATYSIAVVDFLQRINRSSENPVSEQTQVLYKFKDLITDYSANAKMPVVVMSQLKPMDPDETDRQIELRTKWCTGFYECCANVIEAIKLDGVPVTNYHVQKSRFGGAKKHWSAHEFKNGMFIPIDKARLAAIRQKYKDEQVDEKLNELQSSIDNKELEE
jgi:ABC-type dipeptide/oligopeptide/nickel transport system ATPase subunit